MVDSTGSVCKLVPQDILVLLLSIVLSARFCKLYLANYPINASRLVAYNSFRHGSSRDDVCRAQERVQC